MDITERFYDYGLLFNKNLNFMCRMLNELVELGYRTVALEEIFDHTNNAVKKGTEIFPEPAPQVAILQNEFAPKRLRILSRLTIIYSDVAAGHAMSRSQNLKKFNIVAGLPKTDAALTHCCTVFNGDLVTYDPALGPKLLVNRKAFQVGVRRGIHFEIKYAPAIRDSNQRKDLIKIAHTYMNRGKSCNVIFSSGAQNVFELRGPYDVANLGYIFGLSQNQGVNAIDKSCRQVFLRAEGRRYGKTTVIVKAIGYVCFEARAATETEPVENENVQVEAAAENEAENEDAAESEEEAEDEAAGENDEDDVDDDNGDEGAVGTDYGNAEDKECMQEDDQTDIKTENQEKPPTSSEEQSDGEVPIKKIRVTK